MNWAWTRLAEAIVSTPNEGYRYKQKSHRVVGALHGGRQLTSKRRPVSTRCDGLSMARASCPEHSKIISFRYAQSDREAARGQTGSRALETTPCGITLVVSAAAF